MNSDFKHGLAGWAPLGSCRLSVCTELPHMIPSTLKVPLGHYILTANRTETWMGPSQIITDKLKLHLTYRVSAWVRVGPTASGRQKVNVALGVDERWVNGGHVEADSYQWYEVRGSFRIEKQPSKVTVYVQGPSPGVDLMVMGLQIFAIDRKARFDYLKEKTDKVFIYFLKLSYNCKLFRNCLCLLEPMSKTTSLLEKQKLGSCNMKSLVLLAIVASQSKLLSSKSKRSNVNLLLRVASGALI